MDLRTRCAASSRLGFSGRQWLVIAAAWAGFDVAYSYPLDVVETRRRALPP